MNNPQSLPIPLFRRLLIVASAALAAALPLAAAPRAAPFKIVETGRSYQRLADAVEAIGGGEGTIRIAPGRYRDCAVQEEGRITFVAEQRGTAIFDGGICEGKASLVLRGRAAKVDGLVFTHTRVEDGNGAGIRIEKGDLLGLLVAIRRRPVRNHLGRSIRPARSA